MNRIIALAGLFVTVALCITGCGSDAEVATNHEETPAVPEFSANKGLSLPEQTRQSLGLKIVEVAERKIESTLTFQVKVYQTVKGRALASGGVSAEDAKHLQVGENVPVLLNEGTTLTGKIVGIDTRMLSATASAEVLVEIPQAPESVAGGTFAKVSVSQKSAENVISIPAQALLINTEGQFVYTVSGEHLVRTAIKTGASNAEFVEITDGLYSGDQVVLQPVMSLWMTELAAVKGGQACCVLPPKGK
jgi:multidrug efflux pump subunit AcrA (membrane-fusion protein)